MKTLAFAVLVVLAVGCGREERSRAAPARDAARILESTPWFDRAPQEASGNEP